MITLEEKKQGTTAEEHHTVFKKEILTLRNDLYYQFFENKNGRWFFDISYKPLHHPSGDAYSIRKVGEDKIFIFLVDAMGKGVTASITSILSASFLNYLLDKQDENQDFDLNTCIHEYHSYIKHLIFPDEVVSVSFMLFDFKENYLQHAIFGMPPVLLQTMDDTVESLKANNFPLTSALSDIKVNTTSLENFKKLLIYSDGLNETIIDDSHMYKEYMNEDFKDAINYKDFLNRALNKVGAFDDDMTFLYIEKETCCNCCLRRISIESRMNELDDAIEKVEAFLVKNDMQPRNRAYMMNAFIEVLINAYEHGNLMINGSEKSSHMENGTFDALVKQRELENSDKKITINLHTKEEKGQKTFKIEVNDEGAGFSTDIMKNRLIKKESFNGRGLLMIGKIVDAFYYNTIGNKVILKIFQTGGNKNAKNS